MAAKIIDGKQIAEKMRAEIKSEIIEQKEKTGKIPGLAVVIVGNDPASQVYVRMKSKACEKIGINSFQYDLPETTTQEKLLDLVNELNTRPDVDGILVQLPLPAQIDETTIINAINPQKDVDGFHPQNVGKLVIGEDTYLPCTPAGIQQMLVQSGYDPQGKHVVVVGRSNIVGKPISMILVQKKPSANATVTMCHSRTKGLSNITKQADILIAAMGKPEFITADMVSEKTVIIDVGVNRVNAPGNPKGYKLVGDVDYNGVFEKVTAISPVPGGVGPMTITMLLFNTLKSFKNNNIKLSH